MAEGQGGSTFDRPRSPEEIAAINLGKKLNSYFGQFEDDAKLADVLPARRDPKSPGWEDILRETDPVDRPRAIRAINVLRRLGHNLEHNPDFVSLELRKAGLDLGKMGGLRGLSVRQLGRIRGAGPTTALIINEALRRIEPQQPANAIQESHNRP
ncbi:MAG: hypothetical protein HY426_00120 [Candidatus Levybacteria bacterium]|nr:hypothetical protein [Candidatus Levybacteria bacterium]